MKNLGLILVSSLAIFAAGCSSSPVEEDTVTDAQTQKAMSKFEGAGDGQSGASAAGSRTEQTVGDN